MQQIRGFQSNFENISRDCHAIVYRATVVQQSRDIRESVSLLSLEYSLCSFSFVRQTRDIRESVARHSYKCRLVSKCSHFFSRLSCDTCMTFVRVSRKFCIVNSPKFRGDRFATLARTSRNRRATVLRYILAKQFALNF